MAVAFVTDTSGLGSTASPTFSITVSGTNPVLSVKVAMQDSSATVSSVTWSGTSGTPVQVIEANPRDVDAYSCIWVIPAPSAGSGTVTVNKSAAVPHQIDVACFSGAHQTTPGSGGVDQISIGASATLTPTGLGANDASDGICASTFAGNPTGVTPNQRYLNSSTACNAQSGDATGTTGITFSTDSGAGMRTAACAIRIVAAAAGGGRTTHNTRSAPLGVNIGMRVGMQG